jgi:hypothetical protein
MKLYYYVEGRSDLVISDNDEDGMFTEMEVSDEFGARAFKAYDEWNEVASEIFRKFRH